ncbi:MAG: flippase [Parcubacteria group bacterium]|nr:flippase [Parcubacteria group bacterium]
MLKLKDFLFNNQASRQTVAKNFFWQLMAQVFGRGIRAIIVIYAARALGAEGYGVFSYALSFTALFTIFASISIDPILMREISRGEESKERLITAAFYLKAFLNFVTLLAIITLARAIVPVSAAKALIPLIGLSYAFESLRQMGLSITNAMEKMQVEAGVTIIGQTSTVILGIIALRYWGTPLSLAVAYVLGSAISLTSIAIYLSGITHNIFTHLSLPVLKKMARDAFPFTFLSVTSLILMHTDTIMLGWLSEITQTGYYNAARKPVDILSVLPVLFVTALFPMITRKVETHTGAHLVEKAIATMILIALPLTIGVTLLATPIMTLLFGPGYLPAAAPFRILALGLLLHFPSVIIGYTVLAHNQQAKTIKYFVIAAALNVVLNRLFIPTWGPIGAATATIMSQLIATVGYFLVLRQLMETKILSQLWRPIIAGLTMATGILVMRATHMSLFIMVPLAGIIYFLTLKILRDEIFEEVRKTFADILKQRTASEHS